VEEEVSLRLVIRRLLFRARVGLDSIYLWLFVRPRSRPKPIDIPTIFADFVESYGGEVCDRSGAKPQPQEQIADFVFRRQNVVAELKCLESDPYAPPDGTKRLWDDLANVGMSGKEILDWALGRGRLSEDAVRHMATIFRRRIEKITRKAAKQVEATKQTYGMPSARGLILIANDNNYLFSYPQKLELISDVFARHFEDSCIQGFVFFTPNVPMRVPRSLREWHPWSTAYSKNADNSLVTFVDDLGHHWQRLFCSGDSHGAPHIKLSDREAAEKWMKNAKNIFVRRK
jgi:hypothetical protein